METPVSKGGPVTRPGLRRRKGKGARHAAPGHVVSSVLHRVAGALKDTSDRLIGEQPLGMHPLDRPLYPWDSGRKAVQTNIRELRYTMMFWTLLGACIWFYWAGIVLHDTKIAHGYPKYSIRAPGNFFSNRYGFEWSMCYVLWWNFLPIVLTPAAISQMNLLSRGDIHYALSGLMFIANAVVFFVLSVIWGFFLNTGSTVDSMGSDDRACGIYFASTKGTRFCPNVIECPGLTRSDLCRSGPFFQHWLFSLLFNVWLYFILYQNQRVRTYGGWTLSVDDAAEQFGAPPGDQGDSTYDDPPPPLVPPRDDDQDDETYDL